MDHPVNILTEILQYFPDDRCIGSGGRKDQFAERRMISENLAGPYARLICVVSRAPRWYMDGYQSLNDPRYAL